MSCKENPDGTKCPETSDSSCSPFQLTQNNDSCFIEEVVEEALNIGGADVHVFKLLGIHEQGQLIDLIGNGVALSGGDTPAFPASNAFDVFISEWRSSQIGNDVISSAFIGYDFGEIKLDNDRLRYGIETFIRHDISTIKIKQGANTENRATRARLERSPDGITWYGVAIVDLLDDDNLNTIHLKHTVPSRFWRLRPVDFNGSAPDPWIVQAFEMMDYDETSIDDIQDDIFLENRDRDYATESVTIKSTYDLIDIQTELTRFGIELPSQQYYMHVSFNAVVEVLGRPIVIGDIFEVPSETQYSATMQPIKKYLEVTDVGWSTDGYTPGWQPTMQRIIAQPMLASQETQDIFGGLAATADSMGLLDINDGTHPVFQDISTASQTIESEAKSSTPELGRDLADVRQFTEEELQAAADQGLPTLSKIGINPTGLYVEDALPPNGIEYTEGDTLPENPSDEDYHRLTYTGLAGDIPARLFRYSIAKTRWIYLETDKRAQYSQTKPILQEFLSSPTATPSDEVQT